MKPLPIFVPEEQQLVRSGTALQALPGSRSTRYRVVATGWAPKPVRFCFCAVAWRLGGIQAAAHVERQPLEREAA